MAHPIDPAHTAHDPVPDDTTLAPTEKRDRKAGGMPHRIVGLTALFAALLAMLLGAMFLFGSRRTEIVAIIIAALVVPVIVKKLATEARIERERLHPSR